MGNGKLILFVLFSLFAIPALCQKKIVLSDLKNKTLTGFLVQNLDAQALYEPLSSNTILSTGLTFNLNDDGIVDNVLTTFGNTQTLNKEAVRLLTLTSGKWDKIGLKESQTVFTPLIVASLNETPALNKPIIEREIVRLLQASNQLADKEGKQHYLSLEPIVIYISTDK